jgi:hypothetical protein
MFGLAKRASTAIAKLNDQLNNMGASASINADNRAFMELAKRIGPAILYLILAGCLSDGVGQSLGEVVECGPLAGVRSFLTGALAWGWSIRKGKGTGALFEHFAKQGVAQMRDPDVAAAASYLQGKEAGVDTALRRLELVLGSVVMEGEPRDLALGYEIAGIFKRLQQLQSRLEPSRLSPLASSPQSILSLAETERSPLGLWIPLTRGHNAAWSPLETTVAVAAIKAAMHDGATISNPININC